MPVVIALLNSYSGVAAAGHGWVLNNSVLIIAGSLVGAAGFILTALMCRAMNRSLANVMFAGVGATVATIEESEDIYAGRVKAASAEEVAMLLQDARRVIIVPGYGMAVAQAQFVIEDLAELLESKGVEVDFAIHPVAGRMPGHMNVLLAEANIPYPEAEGYGRDQPCLSTNRRRPGHRGQRCGQSAGPRFGPFHSHRRHAHPGRGPGPFGGDRQAQPSVPDSQGLPTLSLPPTTLSCSLVMPSRWPWIS